MPMGFPAYAERTARFPGVSPKKLVRASCDALDELGWRPRKDGNDFIRASVPRGLYIVFLTWGAKFTVEVEEEELFIRSEGSFPLEWVDLGQHGGNIKKFLDRVEDILEEGD